MTPMSGRGFTRCQFSISDSHLARCELQLERNDVPSLGPPPEDLLPVRVWHCPEFKALGLGLDDVELAVARVERLARWVILALKDVGLEVTVEPHLRRRTSGIVRSRRGRAKRRVSPHTRGREVM